MRVHRIILTALIAFSPSAFQTAAAQAQPEILKEIPPAKMRSILQGMGFEFKEEPGDKRTTFRLQLAGFKVTLDDDLDHIHFWTGFTDIVDTIKVNNWNRDNWFSRAYMDKAQNPIIEADLDLEGGVTRENVEAFIRRFRTSVDTFARFIAAGGGVTGAPASTPGVFTWNDGKVTLRYDPAKWKQTKTDEAGHFMFEHKNGEGYGLVIAERVAIPVDSLVNLALKNARAADPNAKTTSIERRKVNGADVAFMKMEAKVSNIDLIYYGYYFGGKSIAVQVLTFTGKNLIGDYEKDFLEFLNGFTTTDAGN